MLSNLSMVFFMFFIILGSLLSLMSNNWILIWCGLEVMLIMFIPMILTKKFNSSECCLKYFIIQSISSSILMLSIMLMMMNLNFNVDLILNISLMIKMGVSPFHTWVLNVIEGLDFNYLFLLLTLMKLPPLCILSYVSLNLLVFVLLTLVFGSVMGLNQSSSRKIIGYSSIFNMGFILSGIFYNQVWMFYLLFYSLILYMFIFVLKNLNLNYINQFIMNDHNPFSKFILFLSLLSMGGMPPLIGFMVKLIVLELMLFTNSFLVSFIMIMTSLLIMFIYVRMTFLSMMIFSFLPKLNINLVNNNSMVILILNLLLMTFMINLKLFM